MKVVKDPLSWPLGLGKHNVGVIPMGKKKLVLTWAYFFQHHVIREKRLSEKETLVIFYNVVKIVERLHARNVVHRDLKLGNVSHLYYYLPSRNRHGDLFP